MIRFHKTYFLLSIALLIIEIIIALYVRDSFVRPYVGDFLVVIFMYVVLQTFFHVEVTKAALFVLAFAIAVEIAQYFHLLNRLNLASNDFARTVMGSSFEWSDIVAYTAGMLVVIIVEHQRKTKPLNT